MSTRYAPEGAPISFERYMSSPAYAELRGIPGTAVAAKAQLYADTRKRSLLFFVQGLSTKEGGLRFVARALLKKFPTHSEDELTDLFIEFCINPKVVIQFFDEPQAKNSSSVPSDTEMADALREFQDRYERDVTSDFVFTTIGKEVFETLDHALETGKMVVIEGESGSGKTTAAQAWCAAHEGETRFISLSGITHKTGFFRKLATAIGLSAARSKAIDMQVRVEDFFRRTRLMLVIDEAHYLWPQYQRSYSSPELIDWVNTALINQNVPVALICTDQFAKLKTRLEKQSGWTSEQLEHRITRYKRLPNMPTKEDLQTVAAKLLALRWDSRSQQWNLSGPAPHPDFVKMVVGYALTSKMRLAAVADTITETRYQARRHGGSQILASDIRAALLDYQIPSDEALQSAFQSDRPSVRPAVTVQSSIEPILQHRCNGIATALQ
jgi:energy-coupling factor transporter ATP-binding protein EcfA2